MIIIIEICEKYLGRKIGRLHEVGCGIGYLLQDAQKLGIRASGNELNGAACELMQERFKLPVEMCLFEDASVESNSLDVVIMKDYIEHTYHPYQELLKSYELLSSGGVIYLETFHLDCDDFYQQKEHWNMLFWNHTHHFSQKTLEHAVMKAGFTVEWVDAKRSNLMIRLVAKKPSHKNTA